MLTREDVRDSSVALLEAAAARLRDRGWQRGDYGPVQGPNCVMGALAWAARHDLGETAGFSVAANALTKLVRCPTTWNDLICPNAEAAVDVLLRAAKEVAGAPV